jgi:hypothetical protein
MTFAAAQSRLNRAVFSHLSDVGITLGGVPVQACFDNGYALGNVGMLGMASSQPALTLASADVSTNPVGMAVVAGGVSYLVAAHEPDGSGVSRLVLELAA